MKIWKVIEATNGLMKVSNEGDVTYKDKPCKLRLEPTGYVSVRLKLNFGARYFDVHRLVAFYFKENPLNKPQVNHIDGNKQNNRAENLEWCTAKENQHHRIHVLKKCMVGEHNPMYGVSGAKSPVFKGFIYKINPTTREVVERYAGSGDAARKNKGYYANNITRAIKNKSLYHGFLWIREE